MKIGGRATLAEVDDAAWAAFAAEAGLGLPLVRRRVAEVSDRARAAAVAVAGALAAPGLDEAALERFVRIVRDRAEACARTTGKPAPRPPRRTPPARKRS